MEAKYVARLPYLLMSHLLHILYIHSLSILIRTPLLLASHAGIM